MNHFIVFRQSLPVAALYLIQSAMPAVAAVLLLPVLCAVYNQNFGDQYIVLSVLAGAFTLLLVKPPDDLTLRLSRTLLDEFGYLSVRWAVVLGILLFIGFATKISADFSRRVITTWVVATPILSAIATVTFSMLLRRLLVSPRNLRTAVFAGVNEASKRFAQQIADTPEACLSVSGFFDDRSEERLGLDRDSLLLGRLSDLASYVKEHNTSVIFMALPMRHVQRVMDLLDDLRDTTISIYYLPDIFVMDLIQARTGEILGTPVVSMCDTPFHGFHGIIKRITDTVLAAIILIPVLPIMIVIAVIVKLTSPGTILFKQRRYGLDGEEIIVYKFRTMTVSEDGDDFVQVTKDDARITPIGHILRRYSLDELPQLLNVLQGRMSLVGPRPHPIALNEQYRKLIKGYMVRHKVLPGVTGLAQVNGCRGETADLEEMKARIDYDLEYLRRWSPLLDIKILFMTVLTLLGDEKAY
jgi:putative colanic acid biosynthesis UDP-glucose lipid carrier transferase